MLYSLHMDALSGWSANSDLVERLSKLRPDVIYDETKIPPYVLPNPLICLDGSQVNSPDVWRDRRRPEILELFREHVYGRAPLDRPASMSFELFDFDENALNGKAIRKQVLIRLVNDEPSVDLLVYLPKNSSFPSPIFLMLNFWGNHTINPDPHIKIRNRLSVIPGGDFFSSEESRGWDRSVPIDRILARGYGFATACYNDIDPDFHDGFKNGVHGVFDRFFGEKRPPNAWGAIGAWAWGLSRIMDYLETDIDVDSRHVILLGHSRLGKTALWAGAQDERFFMVISNNSGCGGAALSRRRFGETVKMINTAFPHWFCENFKKYNDHEDALPVDQHMLIALIAPRPVYVASADEDLWCDPRGEFLAVKAADPVYKLLGTDGLPADEMPTLNSPVMGTIGYHIRSGGHGLTEYDWERYMEFADKHIRIIPQK
ncbi:MAG: acetylxylan esterase [Candidatus Bathyarchaeia archaeon]